MLSRTSDSRLSTLMSARCLKKAQPRGVAKISTKPQKSVWMGALDRGYLARNPLFSRTFINTGVSAEIENSVSIVSCYTFVRKDVQETYSFPVWPWRFDLGLRLRSQQRPPSLRCPFRCCVHRKASLRCAALCKEEYYIHN